MIKKPSEGTYLGRIIKRAQYFFDSLARYIHFYQTLSMSPRPGPARYGGCAVNGIQLWRQAQPNPQSAFEEFRDVVRQ